MPDLHDLAEVHHGDAVGDVSDDREVVRDEEVREPELVLELDEQVDDLRLDRDVERGDRLVEDQHLRVQRERAGDADPLALAARELVRKAVRVLGAEPDRAQELLHASPALAATRYRPWMRSGSPTISRTVMRGFSDAYGSWKTIWTSRRTGRIWRRLKRVMSCPSKMIRPAVGSSSLMMRAPERRLAAPGLADDAERLALAHRQVDAVDRLHLADRALEDARLDREVLDEALDAEDLVSPPAPTSADCAAFVSSLVHLAHDDAPLAASAAVTCCAASSSAKWHADRCVPPSPKRPQRGTSVRHTLPPLRERAAGMERAAGRRVDEARGLAGDRLEPLLVHVDPRQAVHEPDRVRVARAS